MTRRVASLDAFGARERIEGLCAEFRDGVILHLLRGMPVERIRGQLLQRRVRAGPGGHGREQGRVGQGRQVTEGGELAGDRVGASCSAWLAALIACENTHADTFRYQMKRSLSVLLTGAVDYAGLFPPAALDMDAATAAYATYLGDASRFLLGRFVVPLTRLREFDVDAAPLLPRGDGSDPWRLSALTGPDLSADIALALKFNDRHSDGADLGRAEIDALEIRAQSCAEIASAMSGMPSEITAFFEIPITGDPASLIAELRRSGGRAKARTGGITADAFPSALDVARFIIRCRDERVAFKLTAGLHHPIRARYRLTYAADAEIGDMFGYLNMFVAAALAWNGADESTVVDALEVRDSADFDFADDGLSFRATFVPLATLRQARANFVVSFGSCSFREPVDDLAALSLS